MRQAAIRRAGTRGLSWALAVISCDSGGSSDADSMDGAATAAASTADGATTGDASGTTMDGGTTASSGGAGGPIEGFSDEFDEASTLAQWTRREVAEGTEAQYVVLDVNESVPGRLVIVPTTSGWYGDFDGPFLYKQVTGDFVVETYVVARSLDDPEDPPRENFNAAGLLARDPAHAPGRENWLMYNLGRQLGEVATEGKSTVDSQSELTLVPGPAEGRLRLCRVGATFVMLRELIGEQGFTQTHRYQRPDMPATLQVGVIANAWNATGPEPDLSRDPDLWAEWDYIRIARATTEADCAAELTE